MRQLVEPVSDGDDRSAGRDLVAAESAKVPVAVGPFVVGVLSGDFVARHVDPGFTRAFTIGWIGVAGVTVVVATLGGWLWRRSRGESKAPVSS